MPKTPKQARDIMANDPYGGVGMQMAGLSQQGLSQLSSANNIYSGNITTTAGTTGVCFPVSYPVYQQTQAVPTPLTMMQMIPGTLGFYVAPVANGFLVGINTQTLDKAKFCSNYTEAAEAIVALLALHKITEQK